MNIAFDENVRTILLEDFKGKGPLRALWLGEPTIQRDDQIAKETGLHRAFVNLVPAIGGFDRGDESLPFYIAVIEQMKPEANGLDTVRRWFLDIWALPQIGIAENLLPSPLYQQAEAIVERVSESMSAGVSSRDWRALRAALSLAEDEQDQTVPFSEPVLAMAWDLNDVPGASSDVFFAWQLSLTAKTQHDLGWTSNDDDLIRPLYEEFSQQALAALGPPSPKDSGWMPRYLDLIAEYWSGRPDLSTLKARYDRQMSEVASKLNALSTQARDSLLKICAQ